MIAIKLIKQSPTSRWEAVASPCRAIIGGAGGSSRSSCNIGLKKRPLSINIVDTATYQQLETEQLQPFARTGVEPRRKLANREHVLASNCTQKFGRQTEQALRKRGGERGLLVQAEIKLQNNSKKINKKTRGRGVLKEVYSTEAGGRRRKAARFAWEHPDARLIYWR